jgi:hypothetical protein
LCCLRSESRSQLHWSDGTRVQCVLEAEEELH